MSTFIRLEHLSAEVRLPDGERLTTVDDVSASFERGERPPPSSPTGRTHPPSTSTRPHRNATGRKPGTRIGSLAPDIKAIRLQPALALR